jgi:uncharacterized protein YcfL
MKKIIFSALALFLMVTVIACRETVEEKTEEATSTVEETMETPVVIETEEILVEEVADTTQTAVKEIQ